MGETGLVAWMSGLFFGAMVDEELEAYLDEEHEVDEELEVDLDEEHEDDEDASSACAPYLACKMSCLGSRTPGVKDTPFFRFGMGREGGREMSSTEELRLCSRSTY